MHSIDLSKVHFSQVHGQITAYGTWIRTEDQWRPVLVLIRTGDETSDHCVPCIVTGDKIWIWTEEVGDEEACGRMVGKFLEPLRMGLNAHNALKILSIVRFHIGDVLSIPPRPKDDTIELGTMKITDKTTGRTVEQEIMGHA